MKNIVICKEDSLFETINNLKFGKFCIDKNTCSIFEEQVIRSKFKVQDLIDPIYYYKSTKNTTEIKNTIKAHIEDGVALTKFLYWFKNNKKILTEKKLKIN